MTLSHFHRAAFAAILALSFSACSDVKDLIDLATNPPDREAIDVTKLAVNNFFVQPQFGTIAQQGREIRDTLHLNHVRVLFAWTDSVQRSPGSSRNYSFYDTILEEIPAGLDVIVVLYEVPSWVGNPSNWVGGNPRRTFAERWVRPTVQRYAGHPKIIGWEIWNEPDAEITPNVVLGLSDAANYVDLLSYSANEVRRNDPTRLVIPAATQSIQQNFPTSLNYNKRMRDLGAANMVDLWNVHYYGKNFESVVTDNGVADFLNGLNKPIWITESGETGPNEQLAYGETVWPFLMSEVPAIERIYIYEFASTAPLESNFGLKTSDPQFPVSDLYIHLRDRGGR